MSKVAQPKFSAVLNRGSNQLFPWISLLNRGFVEDTKKKEARETKKESVNITKAFNRLAKLVHPDLFHSFPEKSETNSKSLQFLKSLVELSKDPLKEKNKFASVTSLRFYLITKDTPVDYSIEIPKEFLYDSASVSKTNYKIASEYYKSCVFDIAHRMGVDVGDFKSPKDMLKDKRMHSQKLEFVTSKGYHRGGDYAFHELTEAMRPSMVWDTSGKTWLKTKEQIKKVRETGIEADNSDMPKKLREEMWERWKRRALFDKSLTESERKSALKKVERHKNKLQVEDWWFIPFYIGRVYSSDREGCFCIPFDFKIGQLVNYLESNYGKIYSERMDIKKRVQLFVDSKNAVQEIFKFSEIETCPGEELDLHLSKMTFDKLMILNQLVEQRRREQPNNPLIPSLDHLTLSVIHPLVNIDKNVKLQAYIKPGLPFDIQFDQDLQESGTKELDISKKRVSISPDVYKWEDNIRIDSSDPRRLCLYIPFNFGILDLIVFLNKRENKQKIIKFQSKVYLSSLMERIVKKFRLRALKMTSAWKEMSVLQQVFVLQNMEIQLSQLGDYAYPLSKANQFVLSSSGYKVTRQSIQVPFIFKHSKLRKYFDELKFE